MGGAPKSKRAVPASKASGVLPSEPADAEEGLALRLYEAATRDALTRAYNRRHLQERLAAELSYAKRHSTSLAAVLFDIDHFKAVNDLHGHTAGDAVLRETAAVVAETLRTEDIFARWGGEEFL